MPKKRKEPDKPLVDRYHGVRKTIGRPTLLTPAIQKEFARLIAEGNFFETACDYLGIERETARRWMRLGGKTKRSLSGQERELTDDEARCLSFFEAIRKAKAHPVIESVGVVSAIAAMKDIDPKAAFQAATWRLSRMDPKRFGQQAPVKVQHEGTKDGPPVKMEHGGQVLFYLPDNGRGEAPGTTEQEPEDG